MDKEVDGPLLKGTLSYSHMFRNGKPHGVCWRVIRGGGAVVGCVNEKGELSGICIAYIYPDFQTALIGNYREVQLDFTPEMEVFYML